MAVASLAGELAIGQDDGAALASSGNALRGIDGIEVQDLAIVEGAAETGEIDHTSAPTSRCGAGCRNGGADPLVRGRRPRRPLANCMMGSEERRVGKEGRSRWSPDH